MSCSDYLSIKKKKNKDIFKERSSSKYIEYKQLHHILNTKTVNEEQEYIEPTRYNIKLTNIHDEPKNITQNN